MQHILELVRLQAEMELWDTLKYFVTTLTTPMVAFVDITIGWLDCVFPTIRKKLSLSLSYWHHTDRSAKLILLHWQEVFSCDLMPLILQKQTSRMTRLQKT